MRTHQYEGARRSMAASGRAVVRAFMRVKIEGELIEPDNGVEDVAQVAGRPVGGP